MFLFKLPDIGEGVAEAEIVSISVEEGDFVKPDQVIAEVMTDKAVVEIPSPKAGVVHKINGTIGSILKVGEILFELDESENAQSKKKVKKASTARNLKAIAKKTQRKTKQILSQITSNFLESPPHRPSHQHREVTEAISDIDAVPLVAEYAKENTIDLTTLKGTGPGGRIMMRDVELAVQRHTHTPKTQLKTTQASINTTISRKKLLGLRKAIAEKMITSKKHIPHFTLVEEIDMTGIESKRKENPDKALSPLIYIAKAVCVCLERHQRLHASLDEENEEISYFSDVNLGVATDTQDGLIVPVISSAQTLTLEGLNIKIKDLSKRARLKQLKPHEVKGSTFTISSLGKLGGIVATPIINYPEAAILGVHKMQLLPRIVGDKIVPRYVLNLSLSVDHRVADGMDAAKFLADIKEWLESK